MSPADQGPAQRWPSLPVHAAGLLLLGGGGRLGSLLLEHALGSGRFAPVQVLVHEALPSSVPGLLPWRWRSPEAPAPPEATARTALLVFERERHSNGRDEAFVLPEPALLLPWARALAALGVQRLIVVVPHAPAMLPGALKRGFASADEQALAGLGFAQLLILRPALTMREPAAAGLGWLQRLAAWWLGQLRWMVPAAEQPLRLARLAQLVIELAALLDEAPAATRVVAPELLAEAAAAPDGAAVLRCWLQAPAGAERPG